MIGQSLTRIAKLEDRANLLKKSILVAAESRKSKVNKRGIQ